MHALKLADTSQFETLEAAVRETQRGRAFLDEHARRRRTEDTDRVLDAIARLSEAQHERVATSHLDVLRRELETMAASIAQTRREVAAIKPNTAGYNRIGDATEELDFVVRSTERATAEILTAAEGIQSIAGDLRSTGAQAAFCDEIGRASCRERVCQYV